MPGTDGGTQLQEGPGPGPAEPTSDGGSTSAITHVRRGKNCCKTAARKEELERVRNNHADTAVSEQGEGGGRNSGLRLSLGRREG